MPETIGHKGRDEYQSRPLCMDVSVLTTGRLDVNEKSKEKVDDEKRKAATMSGSSFLGGLGIGLLVMWLIMR